METKLDFKKECIDLLKSIIERQKVICNMYIKLVGEDNDLTKNALRLLGEYNMALYLYEERCKANETV